MRTPIALLFCLLAFCSTAQTLLITETDHRDGERSLCLTGIFRDADSVYVQVYSDGELLHEEVFEYTWALTLSLHDYYIIKFTDGRKRVKRLAIYELSDDQIEFVPPIEIDFGIGGNLVLLKPRNGKPDFQMHDVGMSRKRDAAR